MKRSEMVEHIAIELMGRLPEWEKQYRIELANEILLAIEVQGMLPPKFNYDMREGETFFDRYEWEEE